VHSVKVAASTGSTAVLYRVDRHDSIVAVGGAWDTFAEANGGLPGVVGRSLWDFVDGEDVRGVWQLLLRHVRARQAALSFLYRCDAPGVPRLMQMELSPDARGAVSFRSTFVRIAEGPFFVGEWAADDARPPVTVCGWCGRVRADGWVTPDCAAEQLGLATPDAEWPRLSHGICDTCARELRALTRA
jgi:hypothetical protein